MRASFSRVARWCGFLNKRARCDTALKALATETDLRQWASLQEVADRYHAMLGQFRAEVPPEERRSDAAIAGSGVSDGHGVDHFSDRRCVSRCTGFNPGAIGLVVCRIRHVLASTVPHQKLA
jgi:hypothetical protein